MVLLNNLTRDAMWCQPGCALSPHQLLCNKANSCFTRLHKYVWVFITCRGSHRCVHRKVSNNLCSVLPFFKVKICLSVALTTNTDKCMFATLTALNKPSFTLAPALTPFPSPPLPPLHFPTSFNSADLLLEERAVSCVLTAISLCNRNCPAPEPA